MRAPAGSDRLDDPIRRHVDDRDGVVRLGLTSLIGDIAPLAIGRRIDLARLAAHLDLSTDLTLSRVFYRTTIFLEHLDPASAAVTNTSPLPRPGAPNDPGP